MHDSLRQMNKGFNMMHGGPAAALANMRRHELAVYGTFIFGYDHDTPQSIAATVEFAQQQGLFIAAFNHITPFPGTPLYERMRARGSAAVRSMVARRAVPLQHDSVSAQDDVSGRAGAAMPRGAAIVLRVAEHPASRLRPVNRRQPFVLWNYLAMNAMHHWDVEGRSGLPMGDETWQGEITEGVVTSSPSERYSVRLAPQLTTRH